MYGDVYDSHLHWVPPPYYRHQLRASMGISAPYSTIQIIDTTLFIVVIGLLVISKLWVGLRTYCTLLRTCQVNLWTFQLLYQSLQNHFVLFDNICNKV